MKNATLFALGGAITVSVGVLAGWSGILAPDGLIPPPGPVTDTQPSLTTISEQISQLSVSGFVYPQNLQRVDVPNAINSKVTTLTDITEEIHLYSWTTGGGSAELIDANGVRIATITGGSWDANRQINLGFNQVMLGGLRVQPPLTVRSFGSNTASDTFIYYWIDE